MIVVYPKNGYWYAANTDTLQVDCFDSRVWMVEQYLKITGYRLLVKDGYTEFWKKS